MTIALTINGTTYNYPETGDLSWGPDATDWSLAVTNGMLQKAGGLFQLLAEVDFGTTHGVKSLYYKSRTANVAAAGQLRLARADVVSWRNQANSADLSLSVDASNNLFFNSVALVSLFTGVTDTNSIDLTLTGTVLSSDLKLSATAAGAGNFNLSNSINSDGLQTQTSIATTSLTGVLSNTDWTTFNSKLTSVLTSANVFVGNVSNVATGVAISGDISINNAGLTAIASGVIVNADINASAGIAVSKLATLTASRAVVSDGSGFVSAATTTATEIGFVNGVTSAIQTQLDAKSTNVLTSGRIFVGNVSNVATAVAMSGDIAIDNAGATSIAAGVILNADVNASAAIARSKLGAGTNNFVVINSGAGAFSEEATLAKSRGGSGQDNSSITFPASGTLATLAGVEALTNKDYQGGTASNTLRLTIPNNTKANLDALTRKEATLVYATDDDLLYVDNGASLVAVGSGTSSNINYITNASATDNTTGWATYANTAGVAPVNGTGGSPDITWTRTTTLPLAGVASFLLTKDAANRQGQGASFAFTSNSDDQGQPDYMSCSFQTSANYVAGDVRFYLVDVTNSVVIEPMNVQLPSNSNFGRQVSYFQLPINSTSYRLCVHVASVSALAYTIKFDTFFFGPQSLFTGAMVSDWSSFTPTGSWSANTTYTGRQRRVGDSLEMDIQITLSGAPTAAALTVNMPAGLTIDVAKLAAPSNLLQRIGLVSLRDAGTDTFSGFALLESNYTSFSIMRDDGDGTVSAVTQAAPYTFANTDYIQIKIALIPIVGWSSGVQLASQATNQIVATRAIKTANQAITVNPTKVTFESVASSNGGYDSAGSYDASNNRFISPNAGYFEIRVGCVAANFDAAATIQMYIYKNGAAYLRQDFISASIASTRMTFVLSTLQLVKNDYIEFYVGSSDASYSVVGFTGTNDSQSFFEVSQILGNQTIGMDEAVACCYTTNAGQSFTDSVDADVLYEDRVFDTHNAYNTTTGVYTVPVAGVYLIQAKISFAASSGTWGLGEVGNIYIYVNGVLSSNAFLRMEATVALTFVANIPSTFYSGSFVKGDTIKVNAGQNTASTQTLSVSSFVNIVSIQRIK